MGFRSREFNSAVTLGQTAFATIHVTVASSPCWALAVVCLAKPSNLPAISREFINPLSVSQRRLAKVIQSAAGSSRISLGHPGSSCCALGRLSEGWKGESEGVGLGHPLARRGRLDQLPGTHLGFPGPPGLSGPPELPGFSSTSAGRAVTAWQRWGRERLAKEVGRGSARGWVGHPLAPGEHRAPVRTSGSTTTTTTTTTTAATTTTTNDERRTSGLAQEAPGSKQAPGV